MTRNINSYCNQLLSIEYEEWSYCIVMYLCISSMRVSMTIPNYNNWSLDRLDPEPSSVVNVQKVSKISPPKDVH